MFSPGHFKRLGQGSFLTLAAYSAEGGYEGLEKAWSYGEGELTQLISKDSGACRTRRRGFPDRSQVVLPFPA